jgi:hypothetical protein
MVRSRPGMPVTIRSTVVAIRAADSGGCGGTMNLLAGGCGCAGFAARRTRYLRPPCGSGHL